MSTRRLVVTIDELNLYGFDAHQRPAIRQALERELARLFSQAPSAPVRGANIERHTAPPLAVTATGTAFAVGAGLAQRVYDAASMAGAGAPGAGTAGLVAAARRGRS